jgi:hypothetical protein
MALPTTAPGPQVNVGACLSNGFLPYLLQLVLDIILINHFVVGIIQYTLPMILVGLR